MEKALKTGLGFGLTSGVITTLGLMVGLYAGTNSRLAVIGGIMTIAISDAFSDALGIHISKEYEGRYSETKIWKATISTLVFKFIFASLFIIPILAIDELAIAILTNVALGLLTITAFSFIIAEKGKSLRVAIEHLTIATLVVVAANYTGYWIKIFFGN